jgi:hypothetical protein
VQANAIGRSSKTVREFLEKNHKDDMTRDESIKLTVKSLLEVVQTGAKNIEISVMEGYGKVTVRPAVVAARHSISLTWRKNLALEQIEGIVQDIEREKEAGAASMLHPYLMQSDGAHRGGEEAVAVGSDSGGSGCDVDACDGHAVWIWGMMDGLGAVVTRLYYQKQRGFRIRRFECEM